MNVAIFKNHLVILRFEKLLKSSQNFPNFFFNMQVQKKVAFSQFLAIFIDT